MRSPADRARTERALRVGAYAFAALAAWAALAPPRRAARMPVAAADTAALAAWTRAPSAGVLAVRVEEAPGPLVRAWLAALRGAGDTVAWHGAPAPVAVAVEPAADPAGGARVLAAAPAGRLVVLADSLGVVDSLRSSAGGAAFAVPAWTGALTASAAGSRAVASLTAERGARRVIVLGRAGWESRFVVTALEERGWTADARLDVAPGLAVTQGRPLPPDTGAHAAVVVLDSLAPRDAAVLARFVAAGGGVVLGPGTATGALAGIAAAAEAPRASPLPRPVALDARPTLTRRPLRPRGDAVVLERQGGDVVAAARRAGPGRVVQLSYEDTWRWRMGGGDGAVDAHRDWWSGAVAAAARVPSTPGATPPTHDPAPVASLVAALGPARSPDAPGPSLPLPRRSPGAWLALALAGLLAEWTSRRLRGAP